MPVGLANVSLCDLSLGGAFRYVDVKYSFLQRTSHAP